jgi:hypothetical protein
MHRPPFFFGGGGRRGWKWDSRNRNLNQQSVRYPTHPGLVKFSLRLAADPFLAGLSHPQPGTRLET